MTGPRGIASSCLGPVVLVTDRVTAGVTDFGSMGTVPSPLRLRSTSLRPRDSRTVSPDDKGPGDGDDPIRVGPRPVGISARVLGGRSRVGLLGSGNLSPVGVRVTSVSGQGSTVISVLLGKRYGT